MNFRNSIITANVTPREGVWIEITGIAAINTGRNFIGIEIDDKYFQIAAERINNHVLAYSSNRHWHVDIVQCIQKRIQKREER